MGEEALRRRPSGGEDPEPGRLRVRAVQQDHIRINTNGTLLFTGGVPSFLFSGPAVFLFTGVQADAGTLTLPADTAVIEEEAFCGDDSLDAVVIPEGAERIESRAFAESGVTSVTLPASLVYIADDAFDGCNLTDVEAVENCSNVDIPAGVTSIGMGAFSDCSSLTSVVIPEGVTILKQSTFTNCTSLTTVRLPDGITEFGKWCFRGDEAITQMNIPAALRVIDEGSLANIAVPSIVLPEGLEVIRGQAFADCAFSRIEIPASVTEFDPTAFFSCDDLTEIVFLGDQLPYVIRDGCFIVDKAAGTELYLCFPGMSGTITVPEGITYIADSAFGGVMNMTGVVLPQSLTGLGSGVFEQCRALQSVTIPQGITELPNSTFRDCVSLTEVNLPAGITSIGMTAFFECES